MNLENKPSSPGRGAVVLSSVSLAVAGMALVGQFGEDQRGQGGRALAADVPAGLEERLASLEVTLARLRSDAPLPRSTERRQPAEEERDLPADSDDALPVSTVDLGWRDALLDRFTSLPDGDRRDALRELRNLARLGDARALELLRLSLDDASAGVRTRALSELSELEDPALIQALPQAILDTSANVREAAAQALGRLSVEQSGPLLASLLLDSDDEVLLEAMQAVDRLDYEEARPRLAELAQARDLDVAARAARTLEKMGDRSGTAAVVGRLREHMAKADVAGRVRDVKRLRQLHAKTELLEILEADASSTVRFEAQKALADLES